MLETFQTKYKIKTQLTTYNNYNNYYTYTTVHCMIVLYCKLLFLFTEGSLKAYYKEFKKVQLHFNDLHLSIRIEIVIQNKMTLYNLITTNGVIILFVMTRLLMLQMLSWKC